MDNPFATIMAKLEAIEATVTKLVAKTAEERPEWEPVAYAMKTRRVGRKALKELMTSGEIRTRSKPSHGGHNASLLLAADLDRLFPPLPTQPKK